MRSDGYADDELLKSHSLQSPTSESSSRYRLLDPNIDILDELARTYVNAVECVQLDRGFGDTIVLNQLNMCVPEGAIYGLLGPSGCGKTTLLNCIIGRYDVHGGKCMVYGKPPGAHGHPYPGVGLGFMPQQLALEGEFSITELLQYYSKLYGMPTDEFEERRDFLLEFLDMPNEKQLVRDLSGGQQRRVSLCVALLNSPRLLILDEPTVGVDPKLRAKIWSYMTEIARTGTTIIITTHYVEEARQADIVGLMRNGRLLAEGAPDALLEKYQESTLEDTFLKLCTSADDDYASDNDVNDSDRIDAVNAPSVNLITAGLRCAMVYALVWRNMNRMKRNWGFIVFQFFLPSLQVILFCLAIGKNPTHLPFGIVNYDAKYDSVNIGELMDMQLSKGDSFSLKHPPSVETGINEVRHGNSWGILFIPRNFTQKIINNDQGARMQMIMDMTNQQITLFIESSIQNAFQQVLKKVGASETLPIEVGDPVYGEKDPKFTDFIAPGIIIAISFAQAIGMTAVGFVIDKQAGIVDRTWATGVRPAELLLSHVCTQFFLLLIQILLLLFFALIVFDLPQHGSFLLLLALAMVLGMSGMVYGLLIAAGVEDAQAANQLALGSFFPMLLLSGIIWPVQGMPIGLRYVSYAFPTTWAAQSLRSIMGRGWGMAQKDVWEGFVFTVSWTFALFIVAAFRVSNRRK